MFKGLGYDLPAIDLEEDSTHLWMQTYTGNSNSSFELDFFGDAGSALMVNPNSVMPFVTRGIKREKIDDEKSSSTLNSVRNCSFYLLYALCRLSESELLIYLTQK